MARTNKKLDARPLQLWQKEMDQGRQHLDRSNLELSLQCFTNALHLCETHANLKSRKYQVVGNIGWAKRLQGRYPDAIKTLQEALVLADALPGPPTRERANIEAELGTVYRLTDRHEEARHYFARQYEMGEKGGREWKRVACRAVGNLGMALYQSAMQLLEQNPHDPDVKQEAKNRIESAIAHLDERIRLAQEVCDDVSDHGSHGQRARTWQGVSWECIGLSRLSLCYTALADLDHARDSHWVERAVQTSRQGVQLALGDYSSALPLSRFFHGRALLRAGRGKEALKQWNSREGPPGYFGEAREVIAPAIALCMEPSTEHRRYLEEMVEAGADLLVACPKTGYSALDYAVFADDPEAEAIVLEGLTRQLLAGRESAAAVQAHVKEKLTEARLRKGYREIFQDKIRPVLLRCDKSGRSNENDQRETIIQLRRVYAEALAADPEASRLFDRLRAIKYTDFVDFGRLPRSSDGLAQPLELSQELNEGGDQEAEFVIFFSYRWINRDPNRASPDDTDHTQYTRMIEAVETYLAFGDCRVQDKDKLFIWMVAQDFACVNQDDPISGVSALPLIITQCDLVITLNDEQYYDRAWCCVEAMMIQALRKDYGVHKWLEHVPFESLNNKQALLTRPELATVYGGAGALSRKNKKLLRRKMADERVKKWKLRRAVNVGGLKMADKKLSYENDRPKVLFLERQAGLLGKGSSTKRSKLLMQKWQDIPSLRNRLDEPDQIPAAETGASTHHAPFHNIITIDEEIRVCAEESEAGSLTTDHAFHRPSEGVYYRLPVVTSYDLPIFIYVQNGDIYGMRMSLTQGSIDVVDPYVLGLLYYSTIYCWRSHGVAIAMEVSKALLQADACRWADDVGNTPMDSLIEAVLVESAANRRPLRPGLIEVGILFEKPVDDPWRDYKESRGLTELHEVLLCISQDSEPLIDYLFRVASEGRLQDIIDAPDGLGRSALPFAVEHGLADAVAILTTFGANVHQQRLPLRGAQPILHFALARPSSGQRGTPFLDIVEKLLGAGADVTAVDHEGWTPVHVAASWKDYRAACTLLELGGPRLDLSAITNDGESVVAGADEALAELLVGQSNLLPF
ncbi:hypothetical protein OQA88_10609 [Cercophora sp. LCS_1]